MSKTLRSASAVFKDMKQWAERSVNTTIHTINIIARGNTPRKTGFARSQWKRGQAWKFRGRRKLQVIHNAAHYIGVLDGSAELNGGGISKHAPIIQPAIDKAVADSHYINQR
jgi:hypothetical protein